MRNVLGSEPRLREYKRSSFGMPREDASESDTPGRPQSNGGDRLGFFAPKPRYVPEQNRRIDRSLGEKLLARGHVLHPRFKHLVTVGHFEL